MGLVLNPLALPQAVVDGLAVLPQLLHEARLANDRLAQAIERADRITAQADLMMKQADRVIEQADELMESFDRAHVTLARMLEQGEELTTMGSDARVELARAQEQLAQANSQAARLIDMGGPIERAGDRLDRIVSRVRRDDPGA
jgi:ABC-type transporter Mla subunit MlaD